MGTYPLRLIGIERMNLGMGKFLSNSSQQKKFAWKCKEFSTRGEEIHLQLEESYREQRSFSRVKMGKDMPTYPSIAPFSPRKLHRFIKQYVWGGG